MHHCLQCVSPRITVQIQYRLFIALSQYHECAPLVLCLYYMVSGNVCVFTESCLAAAISPCHDPKELLLNCPVLFQLFLME